MELIPNSTCILCDESTSVLNRASTEPCIKQIENVYFNVDTSKLTQFQEEIAAKDFCALCVHKIVIANRFKDTYEDIIKKGDSLRNTNGCCFFCDVKDLNFLNINDNPNNVITKLKLFMKNTPHPTSHEECFSCFDCFFHLNVWFEMSNNINKKINLIDKSMKELDQTSENCSNLVVEEIQKDKENVTPPNNNIQTKSKRSKPSPKKQLNKEKSTPITGNIYNGQHVYKTSKSFRKALKQKLKKFKSIKGQNNNINLPEDVTSDVKMYCQIPYVLMIQQKQKSSKGSKKSSRQKSMEVIVLSDSDENSSKSGVKQAPKLLIRRPIKISLSKNFSFDTAKQYNKRTRYTCYICDKEFYNVCKYKSHSLWHEKPQRLQIDVLKFPKSADNDTSNVSTDADIEDSNVDEVVEKHLETSESAEESKELKEDSECVEPIETLTESRSNSTPDKLKENDVSSEKALPSDAESDSSEHNEAQPEEERKDDEVRKDDESLDNETKIDNSNDTNHQLDQVNDDTIDKVTSAEADTNGIAHNDFDGSQNETAMFESDDNTTDDISSTLKRLYSVDVQDKSDDEVVSDANENGEDHSKKNGKKRKLDDSIGSVDQNSGDETAPKRKKVRFALDYSFPKNSEIDDNNINDNSLNSSDRFSDYGAAITDEV